MLKIIYKQMLILPCTIGFMCLNWQVDAYANSVTDWLSPNKQWIAKIKTNQIFPVGFLNWHYPFSYLDPNGVPSGFSVEFTKMLVARINKNLVDKTIVPKFNLMSTSSNLKIYYPELANREVAIECNVSFDQANKNQGIIISKPFFISTIHVLTKKSNPIRKISLMRNKLFIAHGGVFHQFLEKRLNQELDLNIGIIPSRGIPDAGIMLDQNEGIGIIGDTLRLFNIIYAIPNPEKYAVSSLNLGEIRYVCTMLSQEKELKKHVDLAFNQILKTKSYQQLFYRWFILPAKDLNISFNYPMSKSLHQLIIKAGGTIDPQLSGYDLL